MKTLEIKLVEQNGELQLSEEASKFIKKVVNDKKKVEEQEKQIKELILKEMRLRKLNSFEYNGIKVTYIAPTMQEQFDKAKFKKENENIYNEYVKFTPKTDYVTISLKDKK